jgi:hypothetical protein
MSTEIVDTTPAIVRFADGQSFDLRHASPRMGTDLADARGLATRIAAGDRPVEIEIVRYRRPLRMPKDPCTVREQMRPTMTATSAPATALEVYVPDGPRRGWATIVAYRLDAPAPAPESDVNSAWPFLPSED